MRFYFPPNFHQLPPEIQDNIRRGITQQCIINMHLGEELFTAISRMIESINKVASNPKYKDDPDILNLAKEIKEILDEVKEETEKFSSEQQNEE